jgi:hypothetical protein
VVLAPVHELCIDPEGDVVQEEAVAHPADVHSLLGTLEGVERPDRVVAVETDVAGEVVARSERDDDERQVALDRDPRACGERSVASCDAQRIGLGAAQDLRQVVAFGQETGFDPTLLRGGAKLLRARIPAPRAGIDQEEATQAGSVLGPTDRRIRSYGSCEHSPKEPISVGMSDLGLHHIEDDLEHTWLEDWAAVGIAELETYLAKHAAFLVFLETQNR